MTEPSSVCNDRYWPTSRCVGAPCSLLSFTSMSSNTSEVFGEYPAIVIAPNAPARNRSQTFRYACESALPASKSLNLEQDDSRETEVTEEGTTPFFSI
ncbi:hypothetical protein V6N13_032825 [Hibiscus sabdariffa]